MHIWYIIYKKSHALNEVILFEFLHFWGFLWPWKLTVLEHWMNFNSLQFCFLLKLCFFTRCLYSHYNWWRERGTKINPSTIFEGCYLNLRKKIGKFINKMILDNLNIQEIELFTDPWKFQPSTPYSSKVIEIWKFDRNGCSGVKSTILNICFL